MVNRVLDPLLVEHNEKEQIEGVREALKARPGPDTVLHSGLEINL